MLKSALFVTATGATNDDCRKHLIVAIKKEIKQLPHWKQVFAYLFSEPMMKFKCPYCYKTYIYKTFDDLPYQSVECPMSNLCGQEVWHIYYNVKV
jgi:hypothetical protein